MTLANVTGANERVHNRLLRRVDWRFLLPNPWPSRSACSVKGSLARALEMVSGSMMESPEGRHSACDLVVARNPFRGSLGEAWQALRPGGHCYSEWYCPWPQGLAQVRRRLQEAGFTDVACYWPFPPRMPPQYWLPLDSSATVKHWWRRQPVAGAGGQRANVARLMRLMLMAALGAGVSVPICALARKPLGERTELGTVAGGQDILRDPNEFIRAGWSSWGFGPAPDRLSWLLATGGEHSSNKVVAIVSAESEGSPRLAIKMPRVPGSLVALEREAAVLARVHSLRPGGMPGVPSMLFYEAHEGFARLGESYQEGVPLFRLLRKGNYREYALKATDWLAELAGGPQRVAATIRLDRQLERLIGIAGDALGRVSDSSVLQRTLEVLSGVEILSIACEHRDFSPWNLLVTSEGKLAVLDWESAEAEGLPALDLIYFLTYLAFFHDGAMESGDYLGSYRASLNPSTFTGGVRAECLARYANSVGLDLDLLRPLGLLAWLLHAVSEYSRGSAGAAEKPIHEAMAGSPFIAMWQEELRRSS